MLISAELKIWLERISRVFDGAELFEVAPVRGSIPFDDALDSVKACWTIDCDLMEFVGTLEALCRLLGSRVARSIYPRSVAIFNTVSLMYPFFPLSDIDRRERQSRVRKGEKSYKALEAVTQRAT